MKTTEITLALAALFLAPLTWGNNPCPCPGDTPFAGTDACGNNVCDAADIDSYPYVDACGNGVCEEPEEGMECCGGTEVYDPDFLTEATLIQMNISTIIAVYSDAKDILNSIGPCQDSGGAAPNIGITRAWFKDCCEGELTDLKRFGGSVSWDAGSTTCDWPFLGIPYIASANATANAGFSFSVSPNQSESCDGDEICFSGNSSFGLGGGVSATAAAGVIRVSTTLQTNASADVKWCTDSGFDSEICIGSIKIVGTATLASLLEKDINFTVYEGDCS